MPSDPSMGEDNCSLRLRFLTIVITTADMINERATPTLSISQALIAPVAIFTTFVLLGVFIIGELKQKNPSHFMEIFGLVSCTSIQSYLSITVFQDMTNSTDPSQSGSLILNGILPMLTLIPLLADLVVTIFSGREQFMLSAISEPSHQTSHTEMRTSQDFTM